MTKQRLQDMKHGIHYNCINMKTKEFYLVLLILLTSVTFTFAQSSKKKDKKKLELFGYVIDAKTKAGPDSVFVTLMREDSTVVDTMTCHKYEKSRWNMRDRSYYELHVAADSAVGKYIVSAKAPGYYPNTINYEVKKVARNRWFELPMIYMRPQKVGVPDSVMLDEVVVKATKIKMVQKGDTIIYDASAFPLEEGSMLEALVRQLPGATLNSDGEITVNGEKVEELTLNGKDFFKGNKKVMLENLPSFTVKNIQVYHKSSEKSKWAGREVEQKTFTMDVQLKRQYNKGFLGNVEVAGGTEDRYMARLFALRYTDCSRLSVYANTNNVNENRKPGRDGDWDPSKQPEGSRNTRKAGIDLQIEEKERRWEEQGSLEFSWDKSVDDNTSNSEQFLSTGNTFSRSLSSRMSHSKRLNLQNNFYVRKPMWLYTWTRLSYDENNSDHMSRSMLADSEFSRWGNVQQSLDSAFSSQLNPELQKQLINRRKDSSLTNWKSFYFNQNASSIFKLSSGDNIEVGINGGYNNVENKAFNLQDVNYFRTTDSGDLFQNKYNTSPNHSYNYNVTAGYTYNMSEKVQMGLELGYGQEYSKDEQKYYNLHDIDGWGLGSVHPLGDLPSNYDVMLNTIDAQNSRTTTDMTKSFDANYRIMFQQSNERFQFFGYILGALGQRKQHYNYQSKVNNTLFDRDYFKYSANTMIYYRNAKKNYGFRFDARINNSPANVGNMIDVKNDTDPLNIRLGNPDLKASVSENLHFQGDKSWQHEGDSISGWTNVRASLNATQNAVSQGFTLNTTTGGRTYKPVNVDGNWNWEAGWGGGLEFGKGKCFTFINDINYAFSQNVDMIATVGQTSSDISKVHNNNWTENVTLEFKQGDSLSIGLNGRFDYRHSTSEATTFANIDAYNFSYGLSGIWRVFRTGIKIATDLKMYSRRGYASEEFNTNNLVWNASISRSFFKKKLTARLEMFDILHQLTNTNFYINGQGRTETVTNTLPRYAMLHLQWSLSPVKEKKTTRTLDGDVIIIE